MAFRLFVNSSTGVTVEPEWDYEEGDELVLDAHRTRSGRRYSYVWSRYQAWSLPVSFVDSAFYSQVNSWWADQTQLLFKSESDTAVYSVQIVNDEKPIARYVRPYETLFEGTIELETF